MMRHGGHGVRVWRRRDDQSDGGGVLPWGQDHVVIIGSVPCKVPADVQANASGFGRDDTRPEAAEEGQKEHT
jgi:hypothetical protein